MAGVPPKGSWKIHVVVDGGGSQIWKSDDLRISEFESPKIWKSDDLTLQEYPRNKRNNETHAQDQFLFKTHLFLTATHFRACI